MEWGCVEKNPPRFPVVLEWGHTGKRLKGVSGYFFQRGGIVQLGGVTMYYCISSDHLNPLKEVTKNKRENVFFCRLPFPVKRVVLFIQVFDFFLKNRNHIYFFPLAFFLKFLLECSWLTMLCWFQGYSKVSQLHIVPHFKKFFSHIGHYRILRRVPCAI